MATRKRGALAYASKSAEVICWIDHSEPVDKGTWDLPTDPANMFPCIVWSAGFVVSENDQIIELARDLSEYASVGACLHVLKRCIVYRYPIRIRPADTRRVRRI